MLWIYQLCVKEDNETLFGFHFDSRNRTHVVTPELYGSSSTLKSSFSFFSARFVMLFVFLGGPPQFSPINEQGFGSSFE